MVVWDYFMRRKGLLVALLALFTVSGLVSGYFLQHSTTYVSTPTEQRNWTESEYPDPSTVEVAESASTNVLIPILSEEEAAIASAEAVEQSEDLINFDNQIATEVKEVEVPLTGGEITSDESSELLNRWEKLFSTWQKTSWAMIGAVIVAFILILLTRRIFIKR